MRTLIVGFVALVACLAVSGCGSNMVGSLDATKTVMDDLTPTNPNTPTTGGDTGTPVHPDDYIWYDSEGDDFD
jgi:hypothetical protein